MNLIIILLSNSFIFVLGRVAQLVEQLTFNQWVTGSNPVALTTFPHLDSGNKYNDLANKSLKTLPNLKHPYLKRTYLVLRAYLKIRSELAIFSPQIVCNRLSISWQQFSYKIRVTGQVSKIVFFYLCIS